MGLTGGSNNLRIFQFSSGTITDLVASHVGETQNVLGIDWSPDGQNIVVGLSTGSGTEIRTYAVNTSTVVSTLEGAVSSAFNNNAVSWSPNGSGHCRWRQQ